MDFFEKEKLKQEHEEAERARLEYAYFFIAKSLSIHQCL